MSHIGRRKGIGSESSVLFILCSSLKQGASAKWWTLLHSRHHAKPNCVQKDPDVDMHPFLFTLGKKLSVEVSVCALAYQDLGSTPQRCAIKV